MPYLSRLVISGIRNIQDEEIHPSRHFNFFAGLNGSGKTSLLEAIHLLSVGRSFRTHLQRPVISDTVSQATVFAETADNTQLGISRSRNGPLKLQLNHEHSVGITDMARALPVQLLNTSTFKVLEGSPSERRVFLDWGVFHVKHYFLESWRLARKALTQRNALLKAQASKAEIEPWTYEYARRSLEIDKARREYSGELAEEVRTALSSLLTGFFDDPDDFSIEYEGGWDTSTDLFTLLMDNMDRDLKFGHTSYGPHRSDVLLRYKGKSCAELLSRGQSKLLVSCLKLAQVINLRAATEKSCLILIDDLPSELDEPNQKLLLEVIASLNTQVFITAITDDSYKLVPASDRLESSLFHVKHGRIEKI